MQTELSAVRGRPRKFDIDAGIASALKLFSRHGYDGVGVSEICAELGITPTSLYAAYQSKFSLFKRAIFSYIEGPGQFVPRSLEMAHSPNEVWQNILLNAAKQYSCGPEKGCPVLDGLLGSRESDVVQFTSFHADATRKAIGERLHELGDSDAELSAAAIVVIMRGISTSARAGDTLSCLTSVVETILSKQSH